MGRYYDDELCHANHKYIKREWKNGKWRYYYNLPTGKQIDIHSMSKISDLWGEDEKEDYLRKEQSANQIANSTGPSKLMLLNKEKTNNFEEFHKQAAVTKAKKDASDAKAKYMKTPVYKVDKLEAKAAKVIGEKNAKTLRRKYRDYGKSVVLNFLRG